MSACEPPGQCSDPHPHPAHRFYALEWMRCPGVSPDALAYWVTFMNGIRARA